MINGFHPEDNLHQLGIMVLDVFDQFSLCIGWTCNKNRAGICNCFSNGVKIAVIQRIMTASNGIRFVMDVPSRVIGMQNKLIDVCRAEMKHPRFMMIYPDNGMIVVFAHGFNPHSVHGKSL